MQVKLTAIKRTDRVGKTSGKPFISLGIKTEQHGDKWLSGFGGKDNDSWVVGNTVEIEVETKGEYLNFKTPKAGAPQTESRATNILQFEVMPMLEAMRDDIKALRMAQISKEDADIMPHDAEGNPF